MMFKLNPVATGLSLAALLNTVAPNLAHATQQGANRLADQGNNALINVAGKAGLDVFTLAHGKTPKFACYGETNALGTNAHGKSKPIWQLLRPAVNLTNKEVETIHSNTYNDGTKKNSAWFFESMGISVGKAQERGIVDVTCYAAGLNGLPNTVPNRFLDRPYNFTVLGRTKVNYEG
jgi:hypothetical protein